MSDDTFMFPALPVSISSWKGLTANEHDWIEFIRIITCGQDPAVRPERVRRLRFLLDETC